MADIETLLGLRTAKGADMNQLAAALRGQRELGDALSLSTVPQAAQFGTSLRQSALQSAQRGGALAEARKRAEERERRFNKYGEAEAWYNPDTGDRVVVQQDREGKYVDVDTGEGVQLSGFQPVPSGRRGMAGVKTDKIKLRGVPILAKTDRATGVTTYETPGGETFSSPEEVEAFIDADVQTEIERAEGKKLGGERAKRHSTAVSARRSMRQQKASLVDALDAIRAGARTGPIISRTPTLSPATVKLEQAVGRLAMDKIAEHTFGSLSEAEAQWLRNVSIDLRQDEDIIEAELVHAIEALERLQDANEYETSALAAGLEPDKEVIDEILHGASPDHPDGFTFAAPPLPRAPESEGIPKPPGVSQSLWDQLSPEQRAIAVQEPAP